ncbi:Acetyl esterase/lipase [Mucilaginibacter mallensis]|uniref:Acetyl esterase/lipase n=1 Tax=Mucilaginibacter mallensis TaxID=652787 RepID=A0A1H1NZ41_MUCMA|nr:alpha/beta hydrolase [Mucilaginibacter mallensis]SDS04232.1 Acetyl esterase/lipase [Mucilaginibacter mallensis]
MKKLLFVLMLISSATFAQQSTPILLYPDGVPNSKPAPKDYVENMDAGSFMHNVTVPALIPYFPAKDKANGAAVVICPGGGYSGLSMVNEGSEIAAAFNRIGVTAFILKYRMPSDSVMVDKTIGPLQDAQRAIQLVRQRAAEWGIDTARVGIIGFSAGGHLASTAATHFDKEVIENKKHISLRPSFAVLLYPVVTFGQWAHVGSKENLIGKNAPQTLIDLYSNEKQVTPNTPPTFLVHAQDDGLVPVENSLMFYGAMVKNHVKGEIHIYQFGDHGFGLHNRVTKDDWFNSLAKWMDGNGWLKAK